MAQKTTQCGISMLLILWTQGKYCTTLQTTEVKTFEMNTPIYFSIKEKKEQKFSTILYYSQASLNE